MPAACPNCGRGVNRGDQFCDACGAFLGWDAGESADSQLLPQPAPQQDDQRAAVLLQLKSDLIKAAPGGAESTAFTVKNLGTQVEEFRCVVTGPEWVVAEPAVLSVYPGQEATGAIQAAPPREPSSIAGVTPFQLTVTSALHSQVSSGAAGRVDVAPFYELAAELVPTSSSGRGLTRHRITLGNRGNVPLRIILRPADVADGLRLGVPAFADVAPGTVTEVPVSVYGSRRWIGRPEPKTFSIIAEAPKPVAATRLPGTRIVVPVFPSWIPAAVAALAVVAAAGATLAPKLLAHSRAIPTQLATTPNVGPTTNGGPTAPNGGSTTTSGGSTTTSGGSTTTSGGSTTTSGGSTTTSGGSTTPSQVPPYDLISAAPSSVAWTSYSTAGQPPVQVQTNAPGCQEVGLAGGAAVLSVQNATLEDGTRALTALETDPPSQAAGHVVGVYTIPVSAATEHFRAEVGFCSTASLGAQMQAEVFVGLSQQPAWSQTLSVNGQMASVDVPLSTGTMQISLEIFTPAGGTSPYADVVWVDPRIEAANASPPPARPTVTASLLPAQRDRSPRGALNNVQEP
jgi:hypothetical protein